MRANLTRVCRPLLAPVAAAVFFASSAFAASAPSELFNKTVTIGWSESNQSKRLSDGTNVTGTGSFERVVYISTAGRVFARSKATNGRYGGTRERGPDETAKGTTFSATTMTAIGSLGDDIARRITTNFNPAFTSCTTSVTVGKLKDRAKIIGFDGAQYELIQIAPGAASCSISDGNRLAN